ncbi:MAG: ATPase, partial [Xanthobacteraceae bacterium]|nr:ATPase [Xanthobacteraceae bacterium]
MLAWLHGAVVAPWHRGSIRTQLLIIVLVIELAAALIAGVVTILKARTSTRVEIEASMRLAQPFVAEALRLVRDDTPVQHVLADLPWQARLLRHVRISVHDTADVPVAQIPASIDPVTDRKAERAPAPAWFQALIAPAIERHVIPIMARGQQIGSVVIVSEPKDEIAEVWENTVALAVIALAVTAAMMAALYVLFGRALAPLTGLARGLTDLEHRDYAVRLPVPEAREFVALATRFNALAQALDGARAENVRLSQRLITAQDDERRNIALELHDEVGPSLFGLKAIATSIGTIAADSLDEMRHIASERVRDMLTIIEHLQAINRGLLNRLRPMALGHVPVGDLVSRLVQDRARE